MSWRSKSYDEVPALSVRGRELRRSMRMVTVAWMFGVVWQSCVSGSQFTTFCRMLGFGDRDFGLLAALPFIATLGQFLAAILIERTGLRKYQFMHCATLGRSLWAVVAVVPLVLSPPWSLRVVMAVLFVIYFLDALASPAWLTWMGSLIPRRIRGRYFAVRAKISQAVQVVVVIAVGVIVDRLTIPGAPETVSAQPQLLYAISAIVAVAAVFGAMDILSFRTIREVVPPAYVKSDMPIFRMLIDPLRDRVFRRYVCYGAAFTFTVTVGSWFFWRNCTEFLGFNKLATNILFLVVVPVTGILSSSWWGKLIDRWGRRPVLILGGIGSAVSILPWLVASPRLGNPQGIVDSVNWVSAHLGRLGGVANWRWLDAHTPVTSYLIALGACVIGGVTWSGVSLAQIGVILGFSDRQGRSTFVAVATVLISVGGAVGGVAGGWVAWWLRDLHQHPIQLGPLLWTNWHVLFMITIAARMASLAFLVGMPDPGAASVWDLFRYMRSNISNNVSSGLFFPLRVFGWRRWADGSDGSDGSDGRHGRDDKNSSRRGGDGKDSR